MTENNNINCYCIDWLDEWFDKYKYKISSPLAITLSVFGGVSGVLVPYSLLGTGIATTITNLSVFFVSILLSKYSTENALLITNNNGLANENRRLTTYCKSITNATDTPQSTDSIEPINFEKIHQNNKMVSYAFPN